MNQRDIAKMAMSSRFPRLLVLLTLCLPVAACVSRTWHTPDEVRAAIDESAIIGASPDQAIAALRRVRLKNGDSIEVGSFEPRQRRVAASVSPGKRTWFTRWAIDVTVSFDSAQKATNLDIAYSAINPL